MTSLSESIGIAYWLVGAAITAAAGVVAMLRWRSSGKRSPGLRNSLVAAVIVIAAAWMFMGTYLLVQATGERHPLPSRSRLS